MTKTEQTAADILTAAVEGGINYWSCVSDLVRDEDLNVLSVTIHEEADDDTPAEQTLGSSHPLNFARYKEQGIKVDLAAVKRAMRKIANGDIGVHPARFATVTQLLRKGSQDVDYDAWDADEIVQVACFGEIVYG
jgi:hypothetical protein